MVLKENSFSGKAVNYLSGIMARMHTGRHGKSKSRKPDVEMGAKPEGLELSKEQIEEIIVNYAKQNTRPSEIGQMLKEKHGVKYVKQVFGKRLGVILKEKKVAAELPQDMLDLLRKSVAMRKHLAANKKDVHGKTRLGRVESKIWRLSKYYKTKGVLPQNWKYDPEKVALMVKGA